MRLSVTLPLLFSLLFTMCISPVLAADQTKTLSEAQKMINKLKKYGRAQMKPAPQEFQAFQSKVSSTIMNLHHQGKSKDAETLAIWNTKTAKKLYTSESAATLSALCDLQFVATSEKQRNKAKKEMTAIATKMVRSGRGPEATKIMHSFTQRAHQNFRANFVPIKPIR